MKLRELLNESDDYRFISNIANMIEKVSMNKDVFKITNLIAAGYGVNPADLEVVKKEKGKGGSFKGKMHISTPDKSRMENIAGEYLGKKITTLKIGNKKVI